MCALDAGYGLETDIRDHEGRIYISHDPIIDPILSFSDFLSEIKSLKHSNFGNIAVNVKADGLAKKIKWLIKEILGDHDLNFFFFDASIPDLYSYHRENLIVYSRLSELEPCASMNELHSGIWVDSFDGTYDQVSVASNESSNSCSCAIVSPELHGRPHECLWKSLKNLDSKKKNLQLCTDYPEQAFNYFNFS